ncbi:MAG: sce7726 family protein [Bacteroidales bacterium]|nr:sce7726 family protein [Bacteroidales bacterium]
MIELKNDIESLRSLSQIFSPSNFKKVVREKDYSFVDKRFNKHLKTNTIYNRGELLEYLYKEMQDNYKSEYLYKNVLINKLLLGKYSLNTTTIINEFKIGNSIADFVLLNGEARIFEIKTEFDSLEKLKKQLSDYCQFANKVYIVSNHKFIAKLISEYNNSTIGIIEITQQNALKEIKIAQENVSTFNHLTIFKTLRKQEYLEIIYDLFGGIPDVPNTQIFKECLNLIRSIDVALFQKYAFQKLKERKLKCPNFLKSEQTPYELKHICYSLNMTENEYIELYSFLNQKI